MFRSPEIAGCLGAFKFPEKQGKARERGTAFAGLFYNGMNALHPPFYLVFSCVPLVIVSSKDT